MGSSQAALLKGKGQYPTAEGIGEGPGRPSTSRFGHVVATRTFSGQQCDVSRLCMLGSPHWVTGGTPPSPATTYADSSDSAKGSGWVMPHE
ncbi:hypothetical protein TREES_T100010387 [Tupaia chinensis]|uniref:Uncharacterized protein n=1 Tax=Tupaia chinensis TaxID=246437 RepID=L9LDA3_TUPCH|nr:hypothetical protein TREES_T100010387 [Tupaia chinensis]